MQEHGIFSDLAVKWLSMCGQVRGRESCLYDRVPEHVSWQSSRNTLT